MRVVFAPLSVREFDILLKEEEALKIAKGGGLADISIFVPKTNRGGSIFQLLGNLVRSAAPFLMRAVAPEGLNFAKNVITDIGSGQNIRQTLKKRGIESLKQVGKNILKGGGKKRKMKRLGEKKKKKKNKGKRTVKRERGYKDIFEGM